MEILKKIPLELQRIVVSYSRPEYPYLMEYKISKIYSHEKLFTLQKDFLNDNKMSSVIEKECVLLSNLLTIILLIKS